MPTFLSPSSGQHSRGPRVTATGRTVADRCPPVHADVQRRESFYPTDGFD